jgi:hypothetical protein
MKIIYATRGLKKEGKKEETTIGWNLDWRRWVKGYCFLNYTKIFGRDWVVNRVPTFTRGGVNKWKGYLS